MADAFDLERFRKAQEPVFNDVVADLMAGRKTSHWMWFVFPQVDGLGASPTAKTYAIRSLDEARAYIADPDLGARLIQCVDLVNQVRDRSAHDIFGSPDDLKFRSSVTLFGEAAPEQLAFETALKKYYGGEADQRTLELLKLRGAALPSAHANL